jgi:hypothetical protein
MAAVTKSHLQYLVQYPRSAQVARLKDLVKLEHQGLWANKPVKACARARLAKTLAANKVPAHNVLEKDERPVIDFAWVSGVVDRAPVLFANGALLVEDGRLHFQGKKVAVNFRASKNSRQ